MTIDAELLEEIYKAASPLSAKVADTKHKAVKDSMMNVVK